VLDVARIPEKKSFPPRLLITSFCTFLALAGTTLLVLGRARWAEIEPEAPSKLFAQEIFQTVNAHMPWATPNGSRVQAATHRVWTGLTRQNVSSKEKADLQKQL